MTVDLYAQTLEFEIPNLPGWVLNPSKMYSLEECEQDMMRVLLAVEQAHTTTSLDAFMVEAEPVQKE
jgi:hypothetical protein